MIELDFCKSLNGTNGEFVLEVRENITLSSRVAFFGKSGVGKSTILKVLAGLEEIESGKIIVGGEVWSDKGFSLSPQKRNIGFVFQDYSLFPNLSVFENIAYSKRASKERVKQLIEMMELGALCEFKPSKLSGGQSQRVALARALASNPQILLLDEPFSALDSAIKGKILSEILFLQKELGFTLILVSHDIGEVYRLSEEVLLMNEGKILSRSSPKGAFGKSNIQLIAQVLEIKKNDLVCEVCVLVGGEVLSFVAHSSELEGIEVGESVEMVLKSFSPMIRRIFD